MTTIHLKINGTDTRHEVDNRLLLVDLLRNQAGLTGTHVGCDTSQCGACTVLLDGQPAKACATLAVQADGSAVTTIEGLGTTQQPSVIQQAFMECHGLQCGFAPPAWWSARPPCWRVARNPPMRKSNMRSRAICAGAPAT